MKTKIETYFKEDDGEPVFPKSTYKVLPTRWLSYMVKENLFMLFKIGELKDGKLIISILAGKNNGKLTSSENKFLEKMMNNFNKKLVPELSIKEKKSIVIMPIPDDWLLEDLPKRWKESYLAKKQPARKAFQDKVRYIG